MKEIISESLLKLRARQKRYHEKHKEERNQKMRGWYQKNKEEHNEKMRNHYQQNKEQYRENEREWYANNKEYAHDKVRKRRAKKKDVIGGHFTQKQFSELCNYYNNRCLCCGRGDVKLSADHVIPLGPPYSDEISNIQPLCLTCNQKKGVATTDYRND